MLMPLQRFYYNAMDSVSGASLSEQDLVIQPAILDGWLVALEFVGQVAAIPSASTQIIFGISVQTNPEVLSEFEVGGADYFDLFEDYVAQSLDALVTHGNPDEMPQMLVIIDADGLASADGHLIMKKYFREGIKSGDLLRVHCFKTELIGADTLAAINFNVDICQVVAAREWY